MIRSLSVALLCAIATPAAAQIDPRQARAAFDEAEEVCTRDGGDLWGVSLCGPMLIVDRRTRQVVANQPGQGDGLTRQGDVFAGVLPRDVLVANTAVTWEGVRWTMVVGPLPDAPEARKALMMHESWHRVQPELDLPMSSFAPEHLSTSDGRAMMRLEWRALAAALLAPDPAGRHQAIRDALMFRALRQSQAGAEGAEQARALEMNEGLAEYTGVRLSGSPDPLRAAAANLGAAEQVESYPRAFAYASGPAYGLLLDALALDWRVGLRADADPGRLLATAIGMELPTGALAEGAREAAMRYDGQGVIEEELAAAAVRDAALADYRVRLVDGPKLTLPFQSMQIAFDPNNVVPFAPHGTVYPTLTLTDAWGVLTVTRGALIDGNFQGVVVPAPTNDEARTGDGWSLVLNDGWRLSDKGEGEFRLEAE